jgi:hypothetical protein
VRLLALDRLMVAVAVVNPQEVEDFLAVEEVDFLVVDFLVPVVLLE